MNQPDVFRLKGPLLLAANHPNSFLDAIIVATLFKAPVYSLARGDAFKGKFFTKILESLNMLPVYRVSEGVENLESNYNTFNACINLFKEGKTVLIFSEGRCTNEWHLRPLKKGTARLAITAWNQNISLRVLPLGINYNSFRKFGKIVHLNFGQFIPESSITQELSKGKEIREFNENLLSQLKGLVLEADPADTERLRKAFPLKTPPAKRILLLIPALAGFVLNAPLYYAAHLIIKNRSFDHYDSVMTAILFLFYPVYVLVFTLVAVFLSHNVVFWLLLLLLPLTAYAYLHYKKPAYGHGKTGTA